MSEADDAFTYIFTWHALSDACPRCQALNGTEFYDQNIFQNTLWSASGDIWDLDNDKSLVHPNCRCQLEVRVDFHIDRITEFTVLMDIIMRHGKPTVIYREVATGRFVRPPI